jgi:hypothetical protein
MSFFSPPKGSYVRLASSAKLGSEVNLTPLYRTFSTADFGRVVRGPGMDGWLELPMLSTWLESGHFYLALTPWLTLVGVGARLIGPISRPDSARAVAKLT